MEDINIPVKVKKKVTELVGEIEINSITKTGNPSIDNPENSKSVAQSYAVSSLDLTVIPERIKYIHESKETFARALSETDEYEIVWGNTMKDANGEPTLVNRKQSRNTYTLCDNKLGYLVPKPIKGQSNGCDISVTIALERGVGNWKYDNRKQLKFPNIVY